MRKHVQIIQTPYISPVETTVGVQPYHRFPFLFFFSGWFFFSLWEYLWVVNVEAHSSCFLHIDYTVERQGYQQYHIRRKTVNMVRLRSFSPARKPYRQLVLAPNVSHRGTLSSLTSFDLEKKRDECMNNAKKKKNAIQHDWYFNILSIVFAIRRCASSTASSVIPHKHSPGASRIAFATWKMCRQHEIHRWSLINIPPKPDSCIVDTVYRTLKRRHCPCIIAAAINWIARLLRPAILQERTKATQEKYLMLLDLNPLDKLDNFCSNALGNVDPLYPNGAR